MDEQKINENNKMLYAIQFIEWVLKLDLPKYDMDTRRRFIPQINSKNNSEFLWMKSSEEGKNIFYTTEQVYIAWLNSLDEQ